MTNTPRTDELLSLSFNIAENDLPCLVICNQLEIPITSRTFVASYVYYYDNDLKFKLGSLSFKKMTLSWYNEDKGILELYLNKQFVGLASIHELYNVLASCLTQLKELKNEQG